MTHPATPIDSTGRLQGSWRVASRLSAIAGCIVLLACSAAAMADRDPKRIDECMETSTAFVTLPAAEGGWLNVAQCEDCDTVRLTFAAGTRYFVGKASVSYAELRTALGWETTPLLVCYEPASGTLTRLEMPGNGNL